MQSMLLGEQGLAKTDFFFLEEQNRDTYTSTLPLLYRQRQRKAE